MGIFAGCQAFQPTTAIGPLPEKAQRPVLAGVKCDPLAVRRPNRVEVHIPFEGNPRQCLPSEIIQPDLSVLSRDRRGHLRAVRGHSREQVGARRGSHWLLRPIAIDPHQVALVGLSAPRNIDERPGGGNTVLCASAGRGLQDRFHDRHSRSRDLKPLRIKRHGHQTPPLRINEMAGGCEPRLRCRCEQVPPFARPKGLDDELRVSPIKVSRCSIEQQGFASRQKFRPAMANLSFGEASQGLRHTAHLRYLAEN